MNAGAVRQVRRNMRNVVHNYTDAQVKVREATSNDPWGASSTLMSQIAEYSHNMVAFTDIMQMIWRRLNDHGKNWRHVYKALVLMDYLIKAGNERVAQQCKENIFAIETLKDFQHFEENIDHGRSIRERAKQLVALLQDDERLKQERQRALKARERFLESSQGLGHVRAVDAPGGRATAPDLEMARPQTSGEEELQLQLAIAMSQEEAERERQRSRSDEVRLQMALKESQTEAHKPGASRREHGQQSAMTDLLALDLGGPSAGAAAGVTADPWGMPAPAPAPVKTQQPSVVPRLSPVSPNGGCTNPFLARPSRRPGRPQVRSGQPAGAPAAPVDPWGMPAQTVSAPVKNDPWGSSPTAAAAPAPVADPWAALEKPAAAAAPAAAPAAPAAPAAAAAPADPWAPLDSAPAPAPAAASALVDPWSPQLTGAAVTTPSSDDEFAELTQRSTAALPAGATNGSRAAGGGSPWDMGGLGAALTPSPVAGAPASASAIASPITVTKPAQSRSPHNFLGENSNLVNLDDLIGAPSGQPMLPPSAAQGGNPFGWAPSGAPPSANPFQAAAPPPPSINQIRNNRFEAAPAASTNPWTSPSSAANPFLS